MFASDQLLLAKPVLVSRPLHDGLTVFASGMNRLADIRGAAAAGVPIGVDVSRVSQRVAAEIMQIGVPVLLDSGDRTITRKEAQHCDEMACGWTGAVDLREWGDDLHDMTEIVFQPSVWLKGVELNRAAESLTWLTTDQQQAFLRDPDGFVNADENQSDWLYQTLLERYVLYVKRRCRSSARTRGVFESLSNSAIAHQF